MEYNIYKKGSFIWLIYIAINKTFKNTNDVYTIDLSEADDEYVWEGPLCSQRCHT